MYVELRRRSLKRSLPPKADPYFSSDETYVFQIESAAVRDMGHGGTHS